MRTPESRFTLANFMRVHLFSALGALKIGLDILFEQEKVKLDRLLGHGGFFKTAEVGQTFMAATICARIGDGDGRRGRRMRLHYSPPICFISSNKDKGRMNRRASGSLSLQQGLCRGGTTISSKTIAPDQGMSMALRHSWHATKRGLSSKKLRWTHW